MNGLLPPTLPEPKRHAAATAALRSYQGAAVVRTAPQLLELLQGVGTSAAPQFQPQSRLLSSGLLRKSDLYAVWGRPGPPSADEVQQLKRTLETSAVLRDVSRGGF